MHTLRLKVLYPSSVCIPTSRSASHHAWFFRDEQISFLYKRLANNFAPILMIFEAPTSIDIVSGQQTCRSDIL